MTWKIYSIIMKVDRWDQKIKNSIIRIVIFLADFDQ